MIGRKWVMEGAYFCICCFVLSLKCPEGLLADLEGLLHHHDPVAEDMMLPLGRFKGKHLAKQHLMVSVGKTGSGIQVKLWLSRVMAFHRASHG
jgi:hypothetical protein